MAGVDVPEDGLEDNGEGPPSARATPVLRNSGKLILKFILLFRAGVETGVGVVGVGGTEVLFALDLPFPLKLEYFCSSVRIRVTLPSCEWTPRVKSLDIEAVAVEVPASAGRPVFKGCCRRRGGFDINVQSSDGGFAGGL